MGPILISLALKHDKLQMGKKQKLKENSVQTLNGTLAVTLQFCVHYIPIPWAMDQ